MKHNQITTLLIFSILIVSSSFVLAVTGVIEVIQNDYFYDSSTENSLTNVQSLLYSCGDNACNNIGNQIHNLNSGSNNHITFEYPYNPSSTNSNMDYYAHYIFKEGYLPKEYIESIWGERVVRNYDYNFNKATSCHSPIDSFSVTNDNYVNEPIVINMQANLEADASSAFTNLELEYAPSGYENYYSAETTVTLNIKDSSNNIVYTDSENLNLYMDTSENVQFEWTPEHEDTYTATIKTNVIDSQCESSFEETTSRIFEVWSERPLNQCYTIINNLEANPEIAEQGEDVQFVFDKISNYVDASGVKTPIPTKINYEIRDSSNNLIYSDNFVVGANNDEFNPKNIIFNWLSSVAGYLNVKVVGVAQSSLCNGKTNPEDIAILGLQVDASEMYDVIFTVEDSITEELIQNANVEIGIQSGETNSQGKISFNVNPNNYNYEISKTGYYTETGNLNVDEDKTIIVKLVPIPQPIQEYDLKFIVIDSQTTLAIQGAYATINGQLKSTDTNGEVSFNIKQGTYNYEISKTGYYTETGNLNVDEDKTITIELNPIQNPSITNVELLYPTGGETLSDDIIISWNATNNQGDPLLISIECSINNEITWIVLGNNETNDGVFSWNTKNYDNNDYILRVGAINQLYGETVYDVSGEFTIDNDDDSGYHSSSKKDKLCTPLWECSEWTQCIDGTKSRTCSDLNFCEESMTKYVEEIGCIQDLSSSLIYLSGNTKKSNNGIISLIILSLIIITLSLSYITFKKIVY